MASPGHLTKHNESTFCTFHFQTISMKAGVKVLIHISLKCVTKDPIDMKALVIGRGAKESPSRFIKISQHQKHIF